MASCDLEGRSEMLLADAALQAAHRAHTARPAAGASFPTLAISVDANGAYTTADDAVFAELDRLGVDLVEQPFTAGDLAESARLRGRLTARVCIDEDLRTEADASRVLETGAADVLSLKSLRPGH